MIQRLGISSPSFRANELTSARDAYSAQVDKNLQTAQKQNDIISSSPTNVINNQIAMQGKGQKLDVTI